MKIQALTHCYVPLNRGGAELMLHEIMRTLAERGHESEVIVTEEGPMGHETEVDGVRVRYVSAAVALREKPDRVVSHLKETAKVLKWSGDRKVHSTVIVHSDHRWILMDLAAGPDTVVFNTQWVRDAVQRRIDFSDRSLVLHPPVDPDRFLTTPGKCVTLVNPIPEKGSEVFYKVAEALPEVPFLVVEGGYERQRQVFRTDLQNVRVQGHTSNMKRDVYSKTKVLMMPSHFESFGMTAVEAAVSGIPVVAAPTPGLLESLGTSGMFLEVSNTQQWIETVSMLTGSEAAWSKASLNASRILDKVESKDKLHLVCDAIEEGRLR